MEGKRRLRVCYFVYEIIAVKAFKSDGIYYAKFSFEFRNENLKRLYIFITYILYLKFHIHD